MGIFMVPLILLLVNLSFIVQGFTGQDLHPSAALSPFAHTPNPRSNKNLVPSSPSISKTEFPPQNFAPPPLIANVQGQEPSLSPSNPIVFPALHDTTLSPSSMFPPPREITPPPPFVQRDEPSAPPSTVIVSPPHETVPPPLIIGRDVMPPPAPAPYTSSPHHARISPSSSSAILSPKIAPATQPHMSGNFPPTSRESNSSDYESSAPGHVDITPAVSPSGNAHGLVPSPPNVPIVFPAPHDTTLPPSSTFPPPREITPPPSTGQRDEPSLPPNTMIVSPPHETVPPPLIIGRDVMPPPAPAPYSSSPHHARLSPSSSSAMPSPKIAPATQPHLSGNFPPTSRERNSSDYESSTPGHVDITPAVSPSGSAHGVVPSPPNVPERILPVNKNPIAPSSDSVPLPSKMSPQITPSIQPRMPLGPIERNSSEPSESDIKSPMAEPIAPVNSPPRHSGQTPEAAQPVMPETKPPVLPAPVESPVDGLHQNSSVSPSVMHATSPSIIPDPFVSPMSTPLPSTEPKNHGIPVAAPPIEIPKPSPPINHSPTKGSSSPPTSTHFYNVPLSSPPHGGYLSPESSPQTSPREATWHNFGAPLPFSPKLTPNEEYHSPSPLPSTPHKKGVRHIYDAPFSSPPKNNPDEGHHSATYPPLAETKEPRHVRNKTIGPARAPSHNVSPHTSEHQGPVISPVNIPTNSYAPPPFSPASSFSPSRSPHSESASYVSPAPSPSPLAASRNSEMPDLAPKVSPSGSLPISPKMPPLPLIYTLPPPPPNQDCATTTCLKPYTTTPPGAPCNCVLPIQIGLLLSVPVYTFFPLVSELAEEIAVGVFVSQGQVRITGANAATQQTDKTVAFVDLVPLGNKFNNLTAFSIYQRFWHKQVDIKPSIFGDYEVLYVRYPGLPASPPSSINTIDGRPYNSNQDGNVIKPVGVDVKKRQHHKGLSGGIVAIIILSGFFTLILGCAVAWVLLFKHRDNDCMRAPISRSLNPKPSGLTGSTTGSGRGLNSDSLSLGSSIPPYTGSAKTFSLTELEKATNNFNVSQILGEGGFGRVYNGVLEDGTKVAVKVLKRDDQQGGREFLAEVEMLSRLHHRNLVKLIGICTEEHARSLVYELVPNGSVESHLHGVDKESAPLKWDSRIKIALGAARGLAYLHEDSSPRVIHRDFKASNILLEDDFTPKVSDFGLARAAMDEASRHISTRVMGTFGYLAPEYAMTGHLLVKSDVYSYGVVLLELLTGRKPVDMSRPPGQENLVAWAHPYLTSKEGLESIIDPSLGHDVPFDSVAKVAAIASMCVQPEVSHRPFMGEVVQALKLVCNECLCQDDISTDVEGRVSSSGQLANTFPSHHSEFIYASSGLDPEKGLSTSKSLGRPESGSFRRFSFSGPLRTGRRQLWTKLRRSSGGCVSEDMSMFKSRPGSH